MPVSLLLHRPWSRVSPCCLLMASERRQILDGIAGLLFCQAQLVELLQIHPEFGAGPKKMAEAQRGIARNGPLAVQDFGNTVRGYLELAAQLGRGHLQLFKLFG